MVEDEAFVSGHHSDGVRVVVFELIVNIINLKIMISKFKLYILLLLITGLIPLFNISTVRAQVSPLVLSDTVNVYGPMQDVIVNGQLFKVRSKLLRHWGTTCQFEVEITNVGQKEVAARTGLLMNNLNTLNPNTSVNLRLKPGFYAVYTLDVREVPKKGQKDPVISCRSCSPRLGFYNPN